MATELAWRSVVPGASLENVNEEAPLPVTQAGGSSTLDSVLARPGTSATVYTNSVATTANNTSVLSYTCPSSCIAFVPMALLINLSGTPPPSLRFRLTQSGGTAAILYQESMIATNPNTFAPNLWLSAGDMVEWLIQTLGSGSTAAGYISVLQTAIF